MVSTGEISADLDLHDKTAQGLASAATSMKAAETALAKSGTAAGTAYSNALATSIKNSTASIQQSLTNTLGKSAGLALNMGFTGAALTGGASAALAATGADAAKTFANFDDMMRKVSAVTSATDAQFKALTETAKELGATTSFTAQESAQAMIYLGQAGFDANQIIAAMPATLSLARGSMTDLATTADIMSNIMIGFHIPAENTAYAADVLAMAANRTNTDVTQLGEAMKYVAPLANQMGWSLEETAAAAGLLSNAGIKADMAGTVLRNSIARLISPTQAAQDILGKYGLTMDQLNPKVHNLASILETLQRVGMTSGDVIEVFGMRAGPGMMALLNQGTGALREMEQELANSQGYAAAAAEAMDKGLGGAFREAGNALEAMQLSLGDAIGKIATPLLFAFAAIGKAISELPQPIWVAAAAMLGLTAAGLGLLSIISIFGLMLPGLITGLTALGIIEAGATLTTAGLAAAIWAALAPITAVVVAAGLLVAGLYILERETGILSYSWNLLKDVFTIVADGIMKAAGIMKDFVVEKIEGIKQAIADMFPPWVLEGVSNFVNGVITQFSDMGDNIHERAETIRADNTNIGTSAVDAGGQVTDATNIMSAGYNLAGESALLAGLNVDSATGLIVEGNLEAGQSAQQMGANTVEATGQMSAGFFRVTESAKPMVLAIQSGISPVEQLKAAVAGATGTNYAYSASFVDVSNKASAAASAAISAADRIGSAIRTSMAQVGELEALAGKWNTRAKLGIDSTGGKGTGEGNVKVVDKYGQYADPITRSGQSGTGETNVKINTVNNYGSSVQKNNIKAVS